MVKLYGLNEENEVNEEPKDAVERVFGATPLSVESLPTVDADTKLYRIPLRDISKREINEYSITNIEELAKSIENTGLWQPIIVRKDLSSDYVKYVIVAGERRYSAFELLYNKYKNEGNSVKAELFESIEARILTDEEAEKFEEDIYRDTNDLSRQLTNFEKVVQTDPMSIDLTNPETQKQYVIKVYGEEAVQDFINGKIDVPNTKKTLAEYIRILVSERYLNEDISVGTIKNYLGFLEKCEDELRLATIHGKIAIREATSLAKLSPEEQFEAVKAKEELNEELYLELLSKAEKPVVKETTRAIRPNEVLKKNYKKAQKNVRELNALIELLKSDIQNTSKVSKEMESNIDTLIELQDLLKRVM